MKRKIIIFSIILIVAVIVLTGCGQKNENSTNNVATNNNTDSQMNTQTNTQQNNNENSLSKIDLKEYTTVTYGKYGEWDKSVMEKGSKIDAYPLDIKTVFEDKNVTTEYDTKYSKEWVSFSGYVHYYKEGFFVLSDSSATEISKYQNTIVCEDKNIQTQYGWNITDGEYITIVGLFKGYYHPNFSEDYFVLNDVFIVK